MRLTVLGAAAGGGVPQWNCACRNCSLSRAGDLPRMTQSSVAVSLNGTDWAVLNASPDIRAQLDRPAFAPRGLRGSPVRAVVVTNADVDHIAGLLSLREGTGFDLWASAETHGVLAANPVFGVLSEVVMRRRMVLDQGFSPLPGLTVTPFAVPGKVALFLEAELGAGHLMGEQTVGLEITGGGRRVLYIPGCAALPDWLLDRIEGADVLLFDGTVFADDEMIREGVGSKTGARMGHVAIGGADGTLARFSGRRIGRKILIHINNTNPILRPDSPERAAVEAAGWEVAQDGMEVTA
ncbi:pyrroloquinoline quinone biosynthesis protein PqqB [Rhodobacter calidifons]|uniref:Coenzyme PQQ synthesis protein B n=1 Tax=Rhodobacter calidifons TaxID=2715277 RepID=A0ABX0GC99_9RHOB|nr:pyrroloquinoline quinone biosynthesis protein PqqB [Rhodobacter calidifons]NHB78450.1 pyrroloquinoline quinone biosynthesis protein PqqB [Rhodobacter calidifons]